jgi:hypothetical protein
MQQAGSPTLVIGHRINPYEYRCYKEEVDGSNPASPTFRLPGNDVILRETRAAGEGSLALLLQPERGCPYDSATSIASAAESCMSGIT